MSTALDYRWAAFYYPQILQALTDLKARDWPENTEADPHDPTMQLLRLFAHVGHTSATRLDHVARERFWATFRLRSSALSLARWIDYELAPAAPAEVDMVGTLGAPVAGVVDLVRAHSLYDDRGSPPIVYEYLEDTAYQGGDTGVYTLIEQGSLGAFTEITGSLPASLWGGAPAVGYALYFLHPSLMFTGVTADLSVAGADLSVVRWEYYDSIRAMAPDSVAVSGGGLVFGVATVAGATRADGLEVTITCLLTGAQETVDTTWGTANQAITTGTLGQVSPSTSPGDYLVRVEWPELPDLVADALDITGERVIEWSAPQTAARKWAPATVDTATGYAVRARLVQLGGSPVAPTLDAATEPRGTVWSLLIQASQGKRVIDKLGAAAGDASEVFTLNRTPFLLLVSLTVGGFEWSRVDNFLSSASSARDFTLLEAADGSWRVTFGDGTRGRIPNPGDQVVATYRVGGDVSGNLEAGAIERGRTGNRQIKTWTNPRAAAGWVEQEGATAQSLELTRAAAPASLRTRTRAVTPEDCENLAVEFRTADGSQVAERALGVEEGNGPKTIALVVAGPGGGAPVAADLEELDAYYNGIDRGLQRVGGVLLSNMALTSEAFTPTPIDITASVEVRSAYASTAKAAIEASLQGTLTPTAKRLILVDGVWIESTEYLWEWGGTVGEAILKTMIATATSGVVSVAMSAPAADVALAAKSLPTAGVITITIVAI